MTTYEGGVRVPMIVRWPGKVPANTILTGIQSHMDIYTTLAAAAGEPNIAKKALKEHKQPIDGVNNLDYWLGKTDESARDSFLYYYESSIKAVRYKQWKLHFETSENYYAQYEKQKFPIIYNLRMDPFESFDGLTDRSDIVQAKQWLNEPVQHLLGEHIKSLTEYPPLQKAASFDFSQLMEQLMSGKQ
jgi:arylsulfatase